MFTPLTFGEEVVCILPITLTDVYILTLEAYSQVLPTLEGISLTAIVLGAGNLAGILSDTVEPFPPFPGQFLPACFLHPVFSGNQQTQLLSSEQEPLLSDAVLK